MHAQKAVLVYKITEQSKNTPESHHLRLHRPLQCKELNKQPKYVTSWHASTGYSQKNRLWP